jgi:lysine-arginine-ornithine-binding protein
LHPSGQAGSYEHDLKGRPSHAQGGQKYRAETIMQRRKTDMPFLFPSADGKRHAGEFIQRAGRSGPHHFMRGSMKQLRFLTLFLPLAALAMAAVPASAQMKVRMATEGANAPFSVTTPDGKVEGFDVDIAKALCTAMKADCEIVTQDWDGIIPALLAKKYDTIIASMNITDDRKKVVDFSKPYYHSPVVFVAPKGKAPANIEPATLAGKTVGVQGATSHDSYLQDKYPKSTVRQYPTIDDAYRDMAAGRIDMVLYDKFAVYAWLQTDAGKCCEITGPDLSDPAYFGSGVGIAVRQGVADFKAKLVAAIDAIVADGTYAKINAKYFPFDIYKQK